MTIRAIQGYVAVSVWQKLTDRVLASYTIEEQRLARAILAGAHSRHVGITPQLAAGLSKILLSQSQRVEAPWHAVYERLKKEAFPLSRRSEQINENIRRGLVLHTSFRYTLYRLALPVVSAACMNASVGGALLFAADDEGTTISEETYETYATELSRSVVDIAHAQGGTHEMFWRDRALTFVSLSLQSRQPDNEAFPMTELPYSGVLLRLRPDMESAKDDEHRTFQVTDRRILFDRQREDTGADGARLTLKLEDLARQLGSEYQYPEIVRYDRLLNSGYMAIRRPPLPIQRRDVLVIGIFPYEVLQHSSGIFVKACWFEFLLRVSHLLGVAGLNRSEVRAVEGDKYGRIRTHALLLRDLPEQLTHGTTEERVPLYRDRFLRTAGWFPPYVDRRETMYSPIADYQPLAVEDHVKQAEEWIEAAWCAQRDHKRWSVDEAKSTSIGRTFEDALADGLSNTPLQMEQYSYIYRMSFLPTTNNKTGSTWPTPPYAWRGSKATTWTPSVLNHPGWSVAGNSVQVASFFDDLDITEEERSRQMSANQIAGLLIKHWLDDIQQEFEHG